MFYLQIFGAIDEPATIGWPQSSESSVNLEETLMPFLDCIADFRKQVRENAQSKKDTEALTLCDALRDDVLPFLGVRLEDTEGENNSNENGNKFS